MYDSEQNIIQNLTYEYCNDGLGSTRSNKSAIASFNNRYNEFFIVTNRFYSSREQYYVYAFKYNSNGTLNCNNYESAMFTTSSTNSNMFEEYWDLKVSPDDRYITFVDRTNYPSRSYPLIQVDTTGNSYYPKYLGSGGSYKNININGTDKFLLDYNYGKVSISQFKVDTSADQKHGFSVLESKSLNFSGTIVNMLLTNDNEKLILLAATFQKTKWINAAIYIFDMSKILTADSSTTVDYENKIPIDGLEGSYNAEPYSLYSNTDNSICLLYGELTYMWKLTTSQDTENIIGIKYKGKHYYSLKSQALTAGQGDVRAEKTFIGWMGYPEIGTMEVESNE